MSLRTGQFSFVVGVFVFCFYCFSDTSFTIIIYFTYLYQHSLPSYLSDTYCVIFFSLGRHSLEVIQEEIRDTCMLFALQ